MKEIAVIGAGTMGNGIAHVFAMYGFKVVLCDVSKESLTKAMTTIENNLDRMVKKNVIEVDVKKATMSNIAISDSINDRCGHVDLIIEAATENVDLKLKIFEQLDSVAKPSCILATNTSSISITKIASVTKRPDKVIGMHFMNPVPMMKLVEVIRGFKTSNEVCETVMNLSKIIQKIPVEVHDYPGFVANRILMPMINEAIYTLYEGVAGVAEIDEVMKLGMAHPMGPLALADFIGLDVCLSIMNVLYEGFGNSKYAPCPLLVKMVTAGNLGKKTGCGFYDYSNKEQIAIASSFQK